MNINEMDLNNETKGIFFRTQSIYIHVILKVKGTIHGNDIIIDIFPFNKENYIDVVFANQLQILDSNIEKTKLWDDDQNK